MSAWRWLALVVVLAVVVIAGVAMGTVPLSPADVWHGLAGDGSPLAVAIVRTLRLPRVVLAALVGVGLGVSGGALQGTLRNALAEPYLLGVSGGAAVGAVAVLAAHFSPATVPVGAFVGAIAAVVAALVVARAAGGRGDPRMLLMAGVVVGAFCNAAIMVLLANQDANATRGALWWMMGSVADATWPEVARLALWLAIGGGALVALAREIDVLALGEDVAAALGSDVARATGRIYLAASLVAAATVASAGLVGFVGLVVPHLARAAGVRAHRPLLGACALVGATLVVAADVIARVARPPAELPLGAVTALVGVPFFLARLRRLA